MTRQDFLQKGVLKVYNRLFTSAHSRSASAEARAPFATQATHSHTLQPAPKHINMLIYTTNQKKMLEDWLLFS
jgi:hypothetical protein